MEYQEVGQAEVQIVLTDIQVYAQTQGSILQEYQIYTQAQAHILITDYAYAQADSQILTTYTAVSNSMSQIIVISQAFAQAGAIIRILVPTYFSDSFTRTTTAPPFNVGNADTGTPWVWNTWDNDNTEALTPLYVDGSALVHGLYNGTTQTFSSIHNTGASIESGELLIDIWMAAAGDNGAWTYWYDKNWNIKTKNSDSTNDTSFFFRSNEDHNWIEVINAITTRSAWYRLRVIVSNVDTDHVKAHIWKIGDTEPVTWTVVQTTWPLISNHINWLAQPEALPAMLDIYETPYYEAAKFDNITVSGYNYTVYNQGFGLAQTQIKYLGGFGQAQAQIWSFDYPQWAQSQAWTVYRGESGEYIWPQFGQADVYITDAKDQSVHGQALAIIAIQKYTVLFNDTFTREVASGWGTPDIGSPPYTLLWTGTSATMSVNGSKGLVTVGAERWYSGVDLKFGENFYNFDFYFETKLSVVGDPLANLSSYFIIRDSGVGSDYWNTGAEIYVEDLYFSIAANWGSGYVDRYDLPYNPQVVNAIKIRAQDNTIYAKFWPITESEPVDWQLTYVLTAPQNLVPGYMTWEPYANHYDNATYPMVIEYDNILVSGVGAFIYNQGQGQAQASILTSYQQYGQAQAIFNQALQAGQALASILSVYQGYSQAQANIHKSSGLGQAAVRIAISQTDHYAYVVSQDGAASYYPMDSKAYVNIDVIGSQTLTPYNLGYHNSYNSEQIGINPPNRRAMSFSYYYSYWYCTPQRFQGTQWSVDTWAKFDGVSRRYPIFSVSSGSAQYLSVGMGGATAGSTGSFITVNHYYSALAHAYTNSVTIAANIWYYISLTNNNGIYTLYVNGVQAVQWSAPTLIASSFYIDYDAQYGLPSPYTGNVWIDGLAIYDNILTPDQITNHFFAGGLHQGYAQAGVLINNRWAFAQATYYSFNPEPGAINIWNTHSQSYAYIKGINVNNYGQSSARLRATDVNRYSQTQAVIIPYNGLLAAVHDTYNFGWTIANLYGYYTETGPSKPAYQDVPPPTGYPAGSSTSWGIVWYGNFVADETGIWQFYANHDDAISVSIKSWETGVTTEYLYNGGTGEHAGSVTLTAGKTYTLIAKWANNGGPFAIYYKYMRPSDTSWVYLTDNNPPWIAGGRKTHHGQTQVYSVHINPDTGAVIDFRVAQTQAQIIGFDIQKYGQTQVLIQPITAMLRINRDTGAIDTFSGPQSPYFTGFTGNWGISAAFVADKTGTWSFKLHIDYSGQLYIGPTQVISTNYTTLIAGATGTINLVEGQQSSIHVDYYGDSLPNTLQVFYKRPGDTVWFYLTDEAPPWIPLPSLYRFVLAGAYISPSFNQNAYGLAITQIFNTEDKYRLAVLADKPNIYYPMDEYTYGGNAYYSAINYYSGSYLPEFAADGNTNDGWAGSGYAVGDWWQVSWGNPQTIQTVRLTNRPNYTFGSGRILYSDGTSYSVTFPSTSRGVSTYTAPATNVVWMRLISDGGGNTHPGFSEVEAFNGDATNLVRFPVITGPVPLPELSTIVGRRNATWDGVVNAVFLQTPAILSGTSISFKGARALAAGKSQRYASISTVPLTIPGYQGQENNMNVISPLWWGEAGDIITIHITTPPTSNDIGIYQIGGENQWWSAGGYQTTSGLVGTAGTDVSFTLTSTGPHCVYIWSYNAAYTGSGTLTLNNGGIIDSVIPTAIGAAITVETWIKWDGTTDYRMLIGFQSYDFYVRNGNIGFNASNGVWETSTTPIVAGVWYHVAGIMYNRQAFSIANKIYVNGVLQSLSGTDQTGWFQPYFSISGWSANTSYRLGGTLDEYAIFDHALTAEQILAHYKSRIILWNANTQARIIGFNYQLYSQALAMMKGLEFAQAQARIVGEYPRYGQTLGLITRVGEGLVRMIWTGEYTPYPDNIIAWGIEDGPNQIYYDNGTAPLPGYPGSNAGASWSARFIADATGTWQFRTVSDDNSEVTIDSVVIVANYSDQFTTVGTGHGDWDRSGPVELILGQEYNLHIRWTQGGGPYTIHVYYKRPTDADWVLLTNNRPPWLFITKIFAQAQAVILPPPNKREFGQAQATIIGRVYSQAQTQADILRVYARTSQAQVWIGHFQFALVTASILQTVRRFAQTTAWILPPTVTSQAQVWILATTRSYSQVLTFVGHFQFGKAQAKLNAFDVNRFAQTTGLILKSAGYGKARVCIKRIEYKYGQAQTWYLPASPPALAVGAIKQTYPLMSMDINYALVGYGAHASDVLEDPVAPYYAIDGNDIGPIWTIVGIHTVENPLWLEIDLGTTRTINMYRILPSTYDCFVSLQYHNGSIWITVLNTQFNVGIFEGLNPAKAISGMIGPISARRWRLLVTDDGDYNGIAIATFELGFATAKSPTFAQAQAFFGHFGLGQARVYSWPAYDINVYGQAKVSMVNTYEKFSQTEAWIIPPTVIGLSLASILQEYNQYSIVNAWIIPPTVFGFAQAQIIAFNVSRFAQTLVVTKQTYNRVAQAKVKITKFAGHAQAIVTIMDRYHGKYVGHARVYVGHFQFGQSLAYIIKYWQFAQAHVRIIQVRLRGMGQAGVYIQRFEYHGLAMASIKQQYETYGLVGALLNTGFGLAATGGTIKQTYIQKAQAQADIEQTYPRVAQTQVIITIRYRALAQARVLLVTQRTSVAQAMVYVGYHKFSQAQTRIIAYAVPKFGVAAGYILAGQTVLGPSSEYHTYLVRYNGHDLPGYCQSESYDDALTTVSHYASYVDASLTEDMGLQNISITLEMLLWEPTYQACKDKLQLAATIMRIQKGFSPLYIQRFDRYYLAIAKSITASKAVPESPRILKYTLEFEAKPWTINN